MAAFPAPAERLVIAEATLLASDPALDGPRTVVVEGDRIAAVLPPDAYQFVPGDTLIRAQGRWLMPGLHDAGVGPVDAADLRLMALAGVTTVVVPDAVAVAMAPLVAGTDRLLPTLVPHSEIPTDIAPTGVAAPRATAASAGSSLDLVDPSRRAAWESARDDGPSPGPAPAPPMQDGWLPASDAGARFMPADRAFRRELAALAAGGVSLSEVLDRATRAAGERFASGRTGRIAVGAMADLLLLDADPRQDLAALEQPRGVVLRGRFIYRSERDAIHEILASLRAAQARAIAEFDTLDVPPGSQPSVRSAELLFLDGLPRGAQGRVSRPVGDGREHRIERWMWTPLDTRDRIVATVDAEGRLLRAHMVHRGRAGDFELWIERSSADAWTVRIEADDPDGPGNQSSVREVPDPGTGVFLLGSLPSRHDLDRLVRLATAQATLRPLQELVYGDGSVRVAAGMMAISLVAEPAPEHAGILQGAGPDTLLLRLETRSGPEPGRGVAALDRAGEWSRVELAVPHGLWQIQPWEPDESASPPPPMR